MMNDDVVVTTGVGCRVMSSSSAERSTPLPKKKWTAPTRRDAFFPPLFFFFRFVVPEDDGRDADDRICVRISYFSTVRLVQSFSHGTMIETGGTRKYESIFYNFTFSLFRLASSPLFASRLAEARLCLSPLLFFFFSYFFFLLQSEKSEAPFITKTKAKRHQN